MYYPADKYWGNQLLYPLDRDLFGRYRCPAFEHPRPDLLSNSLHNFLKESSKGWARPAPVMETSVIEGKLKVEWRRCCPRQNNNIVSKLFFSNCMIESLVNAKKQNKQTNKQINSNKHSNENTKLVIFNTRTLLRMRVFFSKSASIGFQIHLNFLIISTVRSG